MMGECCFCDWKPVTNGAPLLFAIYPDALDMKEGDLKNEIEDE